jgi:protein-L-isoaspartate(D-aspartate) O-methyltransferase
MSDTPRNAKFPLRLEQTSSRQEPGPALAGTGRLLRPQAPLAHAAQATRLLLSTPTGLGLDSADVRRRMVAKLQATGLSHPAVLAAFQAVPRHSFIDSALVAQAYEDTSLPIGYGQTISKPSVVGRMMQLLLGGMHARQVTELAGPGPLGRVLEIGTGCGYQAALLACISKNVMSVERLKPLHDKARELLRQLRKDNLRLIHADGMLGHAPNAPYDSIIAAAGGDALPEAWLSQLAVGGRLVAPVTQLGHSGKSKQALMVVDRTAHGLQSHVLEDVLFVPLKSGTL